MNMNSFMNDSKYSSLISKFLIYWLLNVAFYFIGSNAIFWGISVTMLNLLAFVLYLMKKKDFVFIDIKMICYGISDIYCAFLFALLSYRFFATFYFNNILILIVMLFAVSMCVCLSWIMMCFLIKIGKNTTENNKKTFSVLGSVIGLVLARYLFTNSVFFQKHSMLVVSAVCFIVAVSFAVKGGKNILRYLLNKTGDGSYT